MNASVFLRCLLLLIVLGIVGCVYHQADAAAMVKDMNNTTGKKEVYINILFYEGADERFDYFSHVYAMVGTKHYKVPVDQFILDRFPRTDDSQRWLQIRQIGEGWTASRLDRSSGIWVADKYGVRIEMRE